MKLIIAILHQEDEPLAVEDLNKKRIFCHKACYHRGLL